jgi:WD40 repeat protein
VAELARWSSNGAAFRVAFSPNGRMLALGSSDDTVQLWGADSSQLLRTLEGHTWYITSVAFSPDERMLASGSADGTARLWGVAAMTH